MPRFGLFGGSSITLVLTSMASLHAIAGLQATPRRDGTALEMSKAVACKRIEAYEKYTLLPDASLTSDEKLQVYYRPLHFKVVPVEKAKPGHRYRAKFSQDGRIRRKGEKTILMKKDLILEYEPTFDAPDQQIYLVNNVGLKGLLPGDYEYDIILRDALEPNSSVTQTLSFTILPTPKVEPPPKTEGPDEPEGSTGPATVPKEKSKTPKKSKPKPGSGVRL